MREAGSGWNEIKSSLFQLMTLEFMGTTDTINSIVFQPLRVMSTSLFNCPRGIIVGY